MLHKLVLVLGAAVLMVAPLAHATEAAAHLETDGVEFSGKVPGAPESGPADDIHWDFITCTHDTHECLHEASHHGYPHWRAVHDTHTCHGHMHYACYGGHH